MIRVSNIFVPINEENNIDEFISKKLKIKKEDILFFNINKKSLDARKGRDIHYVYEVDIQAKDEKSILKKNKSIIKTPLEEFKFLGNGTLKMKTRPVVVGSGPAGLFCAYFLAENGFKPLIIERGEEVEKRVETVNEFFKTGKLNSNSNVCFGEGGAGTFSDGKLNTLTKDKRFMMKKVFEIFTMFGANKEIMYEKNPHIGTDVLRKVIKNMRCKMIEMGAEFRFNTMLTDINIKDNKIESIVLDENEKVPCEVLVLAIGHSARDTFKMLYKNNINMSNKPFAVGVRVVHPQEMIDKNQYKDKYGLINKSASYKLTHNTKSGRGVYSFCMCPGGYVVNSSSSKECLVVNGMSNYKRDSGTANGAIVVTVSEKDFGNGVFDGMKFQEKLEKEAYKLGNGMIPVQKFNDFKDNKVSNAFDINNVKGLYKSANLNELFPSFIKDSLLEGMETFEKKIKGFSSSNPALLAVESKTSSPVRINRDDSLMSNIYGIYPCGEGSGYAGGITTSAMDGIKVSEKIMGIYRSE